MSQGIRQILQTRLLQQISASFGVAGKNLDFDYDQTPKARISMALTQDPAR
jgi:hypothetical protein